MRRSARTDCNQAQIVAALREIGATVQPLHVIGKGCPDLLVGHGGQNWLLELKNGSKPPSKRTLTPDEQGWHSVWQGQVAVVNDAEEAIALIRVCLANAKKTTLRLKPLPSKGFSVSFS